MILYHYTAVEYLDAIRREGLTLGDIPISPTEAQNAVWLTTSRDSAGHGLTEERQLTIHEKRLLGHPIDSDKRFPNKRRIRIAVRILASDKRLVKWRIWSAKRIDAKWRKRLEDTAGGAEKAKTWWLYWDTISPSQFVEVVDLHQN